MESKNRGTQSPIGKIDETKIRNGTHTEGKKNKILACLARNDKATKGDLNVKNR